MRPRRVTASVSVAEHRMPRLHTVLLHTCTWTLLGVVAARDWLLHAPTA